MAYVGLAKPYIAKLVNEAARKYTDGFVCGKAMSVNIVPNYNEGKLYADNQLVESVKEFKDGTITLGTDRLPKQADSVCFGHEARESGTSYKTGDSANYVGVGFYVDELLDGIRKYVAIVIYKVKFNENEEGYTTKGDNIEFKTPTITGTILGLSDELWKDREIFDTKTEADEWLKKTLCISDESGPEGSGPSGEENGGDAAGGNLDEVVSNTP